MHGVQDRPLIVAHHAGWLEVRSNQSFEPVHDLAVKCLLLACHQDMHYRDRVILVDDHDVQQLRKDVVVRPCLERGIDEEFLSL